MADRNSIASLVDGDRIDRVLLLRQRHLRQAPTGGSFLLGQVQDASGALGLVWWGCDEERANRLEEGGTCRVRGRVEAYRDRLQIVATAIEPAPEGTVGDLVARSQASRQGDWWGQAQALIAAVDNPHLRALLEAILIADETLSAGFRSAPAGMTMHHPWVGGLLEHTVNVVRLAHDVADHHPEIDRDLLVTGAFLHDLLKCREYEERGGFAFTTWGNLVGHLVGGAVLVAEKAATIDNFPPRLLEKVQHLIVSHHGELSHGAAKEPVLLEAVVLHLLDNLDARIEAFTRAVRESRGDGEWTEASRLFGRRLYRGP